MYIQCGQKFCNIKCLIFLIAADMKTGGGVYKGEPKQGKADCTLTIDDKNMLDMASGKLNGQTVSLRGKKEGKIRALLD